jgi:hypothetical protein
VDTTLSVQQLYEHDPLLVLLRDRLRLSNGWIIAGAALLAGGDLFGLAALAGERFSLRDVLMGDELRSLLQTLVIVPIGFALYLWLPNAIADLFNTLKANGIIDKRRPDRPGPESYEDSMKELVTWADSRWWVVGALISVALYWLYRLLVTHPAEFPTLSPAWRQLWLRVATLLLADSPGLYAAFFIIVRLLVVLVFTNRLFHLFSIRVNPLHPDGCAGLGVLGRLLTVSVLIATALGAAAVGMSISLLSTSIHPLSRLENVILGAGYVVFTPLLLIGWLASPHRAMKEARDATLQPLADEFQRAIAQAVPSAQDDAVAIKADTDRLAELKRRYELLRDSFPIWPIRIQLLHSLVATAILPLISSLIPLVSNAIVGLFK